MLSRRTVTLAALTLALVPALARPAAADDAARRLLEAIYTT